jgi:putative inorganic carbon (HCO3(-)) transporter
MSVKQSDVPPIEQEGGPVPPRSLIGGPGATFWKNRLAEAGLILSMGLYYVVGNPNLQFGILPHINPLYSLPFLLAFAVLCWYRLPCALALLPLSFPYYYLQKVVFSHYGFSLVEIGLGVCLVVAVLRLLLRPAERQYLLTWPELRGRFGPFLIPILVFVAAAAISIVIAYEHTFAARAFREEVFDPLLYVVLLCMYLRTRVDIQRLLAAFIGSGVVIALLGLAQYFAFRYTIPPDPVGGIQRIYAVYGSANNIGLLFDYVMPIAFAVVFSRLAWKYRLLALVPIALMGGALYLTQSRGSWMVAIPIGLVFVVAFALRKRKVLLASAVAALLVLALVGGAFHTKIWNYVMNGHISTDGVSTVTKRIYLWETALDMIHDSPWVGYGMDNWLCHYSKNDVCPSGLHQYWIKEVNGVPTGLADEPTLSHPHNVFLHVWVSMGVFGVLAFAALLALFYWLFARILQNLQHLDTYDEADKEQLRCMVVGVGAALLAAMAQGQIDSAFLEQDLAFFFWTLLAALLILRVLSHTPWRKTAETTI